MAWSSRSSFDESAFDHSANGQSIHLPGGVARKSLKGEPLAGNFERRKSCATPLRQLSGNVDFGAKDQRRYWNLSPAFVVPWDDRHLRDCRVCCQGAFHLCWI